LSQVINPYWNRRGVAVSRVRRPAGIKTKRVRLSAAIYTVGLVILIGACYAYHRQTSSELQEALVKEHTELAKVEKLQIETERLQTEIERIKKDPKMIEFLARQNLGLIRPGEVVIRLGPAATDSAEAPNSVQGDLAGADSSQAPPTR
jgi:cell division protein FtsB